MPPTIQTGSAADRDRKQRLGEKKSDLVCRVKYCNTLPDIPFDPKFITYPFLPNRFVEYKPTSLERNYKHDLLTEHDLGVTIDLINPDTYAVDPALTLHADDERLLEEDTLTPQDSKRSRHHNKAVPWLKKTEYISNEFNRYGHSSEKTETKVGYNVKKLFKEENVYMDRESQITAINKTFSDAKIPIEKHYSKPNVHPVEVLPVFPDHQLWRYPFAQVMFDTDPASASQMDEMSQAMIRGVMDESGEQFVAYFLPNEETMKKRKRDADEGVEYADEDEYEYRMAREYNWNVKNKASKGYEENYFFVFREGSVYYNELETRVRLSKRRLKPGTQPNNSKLVVKHRSLNENEFRTQEVRMTNLDQPQEEEEEEEEEAEKEEEKEEAEKEDSAGEAEDDVEKAGSAASESEPERDEESDQEENKVSAESDQENKDSDQENKDSDQENKDSDQEENRDSDQERKSSPKSSSSAGSRKSSSSSSSSPSSESEAEDDQKDRKRDEEEIFGSDSD